MTDKIKRIDTIVYAGRVKDRGVLIDNSFGGTKKNWRGQFRSSILSS